jgi:hypothetical protein
VPEWNTNERGQKDRRDIEERLTAFYGPGLREQPLSQSSWEHLKDQLSPHNALPRRAKWRRPTKQSWTITPVYIQDAFARIAYEARTTHTSSLLQCTFKAILREPVVHITPLIGRSIRVTLPFDAEISLGRAELDVLLATGLARYLCVRRSIYVFMHLLLPIFVLGMLLACLNKFMGVISLTELLIIIGLCTVGGLVVLWLLRIQGYKLAFRADHMMLNWLGRNRVCQGLHALANHSRKPYRGRWNEPSLAERIERVCGTHVDARDHNLTLVR